ncbi:MAG: hypothetical protein KY391_05130 [Actinobacteria bacterium]|nr:hypothetical protein [Actinomycetota bacterium]
MTALIGGALVLIAAAAITLVIGWIGADPPLIWVSIGASVVAAVLLALGYHRSREEIAAQARPTVQTAEGEVVAVPTRQRYHKPDCRYARVKEAEAMSATAARRRGYDACTICKP